MHIFTATFKFDTFLNTSELY